MFEVQLWAGVMAMAPFLNAGFKLPPAASAAFFERLVGTQLPRPGECGQGAAARMAAGVRTRRMGRLEGRCLLMRLDASSGREFA